MFGGSGLLSRTVKDFYPNAEVIYNDFDGFSKRLNAIPQTNELLSQLRMITKDLEPKKLLHLLDKDKIVDAIIKHEDKYGYVDCVTVSSSVLFSGQHCNNTQDFSKHLLYNRIRKSDISTAERYLDGLEVLKSDYRELFEQYKNTPNVVFLVDPPYLSTDVKSYNSGSYWKLKDYLNVLDVLNGNSYFYFTSDKSNLVELCDWFGEKFNANPFADAIKKEVSNSVNYSSKYTDIMLYKRLI